MIKDVTNNGLYTTCNKHNNNNNNTKVLKNVEIYNDIMHFFSKTLEQFYNKM